MPEANRADLERACESIYQRSGSTKLPTVDQLAAEVASSTPLEPSRSPLSREERDQRDLAERLLRADFQAALDNGRDFDELEHRRRISALVYGPYQKSDFLRTRTAPVYDAELVPSLGEIFLRERFEVVRANRGDFEELAARKAVAKRLYGDPERFWDVPTRIECKEQHELRLAKLAARAADFEEGNTHDEYRPQRPSGA